MTAPTPDIARLDVPLAQLTADLEFVRLKREADDKARRDALAEEQRQYRELDADSYFTMPGCVCPACPPAGVTIPRADTQPTGGQS